MNKRERKKRFANKINPFSCRSKEQWFIQERICLRRGLHAQLLLELPWLCQEYYRTDARVPWTFYTPWIQEEGRWLRWAGSLEIRCSQKMIFTLWFYSSFVILLVCRYLWVRLEPRRQVRNTYRPESLATPKHPWSSLRNCIGFTWCGMPTRKAWTGYWQFHQSSCS